MYNSNAYSEAHCQYTITLSFRNDTLEVRKNSSISQGSFHSILSIFVHNLVLIYAF